MSREGTSDLIVDVNPKETFLLLFCLASDQPKPAAVKPSFHGSSGT